MNITFKALILAIAMTFLGPVLAHASVDCKATEDQFYKEAAELNPKILVASDNARTQIVERINQARKEVGQEPFDVDKLTIGIFQYKGQVMVGTAMFKKGCLVIGTVKAFPADQFISFLESIGISIEEFKPQVGA